MKRIIIYFFCVITIGCITSSILYWEKEKPEGITVEKYSGENEKTNSEELATQAVESVIKIADEAYETGYLVRVEEGYLIIYNQNTGTFYDSTSIFVEDLPSHLQIQLEEGLYFKNEQELYEFLENYSS